MISFAYTNMALDAKLHLRSSIRWQDHAMLFSAAIFATQGFGILGVFTCRNSVIFICGSSVSEADIYLEHILVFGALPGFQLH